MVRNGGFDKTPVSENERDASLDRLSSRLFKQGHRSNPDLDGHALTLRNASYSGRRSRRRSLANGAVARVEFERATNTLDKQNRRLTLGRVRSDLYVLVGVVSLSVVNPETALVN